MNKNKIIKKAAIAAVLDISVFAGLIYFVIRMESIAATILAALIYYLSFRLLRSWVFEN